MIHFSHLALSEDILQALEQLKIDYVFQPIFEPDGKTIYAREALMRPKDKTVTELIEEYTQKDMLHVIEVATFFGASQAFLLRGYEEKLSINSFPCECFTEQEFKTYVDYYGQEDTKIIIEMLEYPKFSLDCHVKKKEMSKVYNSIISIDDYGTGINDMERVKVVDPKIVKLDRTLISDIDKDESKQLKCKDLIENLHIMEKLVVAEGVETKEEFDYLKKLGADLFQGYYLARPS